MITDDAPVSIGRTDELIFEEKPGGLIWVIFALGVAIFVALFIGSMPPTTLQNAGLALMSVVFGGVCALLTVFSYRTRGDSQRFFGDRVEVFRRGQLMHTLPYSQVQFVAHGFRDGNDQFLTFSGPQKQPLISLSLIGNSSQAKAIELNDRKLMALRDLLYEVVAERMVDNASQSDGAPWFKELRISQHGLRAGGSLIPWSDVSIEADQLNGSVLVQRSGHVLGQTSMIEDNVVAGLIAIERLRTA